VYSDSQGAAVVGTRARRGGRPVVRNRRLRRFSAAHVVWGGLLRILQRIVHYKHGDRLEFRLNFSVRDLLAEKSRAVRDRLEALVQAVQKAGSYQAREDAARAMHAVMDALRERVPPDVLSRLVDSLQLGEAVRLGRVAAGRVLRDDSKGAADRGTVIEAEAGSVNGSMSDEATLGRGSDRSL
jgi:uncharacterized protein (DUF2267 family)